jgi:glycerophosphoryl diester phosphodiesterase
VQEITAKAVEAALGAGTGGIYPRASNATRESTRMAERAGLSVRGWGVGNESDLLQIYGAGAAGTTVDWRGTHKPKARMALDAPCGPLR